MRFCIIIDGSNFINRLLEHGVSKEYILNEFSLFEFAKDIRGILKAKDLGFQLFTTWHYEFYRLQYLFSLIYSNLWSFKSL